MNHRRRHPHRRSCGLCKPHKRWPAKPHALGLRRTTKQEAIGRLREREGREEAP